MTSVANLRSNLVILAVLDRWDPAAYNGLGLSGSSGMTYSVVFPGQGAQSLRMGEDFVEAFPVARLAFEEASAACDLDLLSIVRDESRLHLTEYTQPTLLAAEVAMFRTLAAEFGLHASCYAGHSLGEFSALVAADVISLGAAARLVRFRGQAMQQAVPVGQGGMVAVIGKGLDLEALRGLAASLSVDLANHNSPSQAVFSGLQGQVDAFVAAVNGRGGSVMVVPLQVSAPFHSRLMQPAADAFADELARAVGACRVEALDSVLSNRSGERHRPCREALIGALSEQIDHSVRWMDNMRLLIALGQPIVEVGPKPILKRFFKELGVAIQAVATTEQARSLLGDAGE